MQCASCGKSLRQPALSFALAGHLVHWCDACVARTMSVGRGLSWETLDPPSKTLEWEEPFDPCPHCGAPLTDGGCPQCQGEIG